MAQYQEIIDRYKIPIALSIVGVVLIIGGMVSSSPKVKEYPQESLSGGPSVKSQKELLIDVSGAVLSPGVYKLAEGSRVEEAIKAAGGLSDNSNQEYISKNINMAQKLSDGVKIYIPFEGEVGIVSGASIVSSSSQVNINSGSQIELEALPGVGTVTASKIISGRPYQKIEELLDKKIVGKATFEKIKDSLTLF